MRIRITRLLAPALITAVALTALACSSNTDPGTAPPPIAVATGTSAAATPAPASNPQASPTLRSPTPVPAASTPPAASPVDASGRIATRACDMLARWLGPVSDTGAIKVTSVEPVTWSNSCFDLALTGHICETLTEAIDGHRVLLDYGGAAYELRADLPGDLMLWAPSVEERGRFLDIEGGYIRFRTDDGRTILADQASGSHFGVAPWALEEGHPVAIALAPAPRGEGLLLVWVVPLP